MVEVTQKDSQGHSIKLVVKFASWIKGSDAKTLSSTWNSLGGNLNTMPYDITGATSYEQDAFLLGTVSLVNQTTGFPLGTYANSTMVPFSVNCPNEGDDGNSWIADSVCDDLQFVAATQYGSDEKTEPSWVAKPDLSNAQDDWGPVPFAIEVSAAFTAMTLPGQG